VAGPARSPSRVGPLVQPPLNGATSGLVLEYRPAGLGYQIHTCIVVRSGCQKLNLDYWATGGRNLRVEVIEPGAAEWLPAPHQALHTVSEEHYLREAGQHLPRGHLTSGDHGTQSPQTGHSEQAAPRMGQ